MVKIPSIDVDSGEEWREGSLPPEYSLPATTTTNRRGDPETCSLRSHISENSFKTASSEPQLNLVPRQVSETYSSVSASERSAEERKAIKQQYSTMAPTNGPVLVKQNSFRAASKQQ